VRSAADVDATDAAATLDGRGDTWWTARNRGQLTYGLRRRRLVGKVGISFHRGETRTTRIRLLTSVDGDHRDVAAGAISSGETSAQETFDFVDRAARFVRVVGLGNSLDRRSTISQVRVN